MIATKYLHITLILLVIAPVTVSFGADGVDAHDQGQVSGLASTTVTHTQGRRGYHGLEAIWLAQHVPDHGINRDDLIVGWIYESKPDEEIRGLIKFMNLRIPVGAEILEARLTLPATQVIGSPRLAAYGLLRDFTVSDSAWGPATKGITTWKSQHHGKISWAQSGADGPGEDFASARRADRFESPDTTVTIKNPGRVVFDVTKSFQEQFAADKTFGWLIRSEFSQPGQYVVFAKDRAELKVTYIPTSEDAVTPSDTTKPRLICFDLAYPEKIVENLGRAKELPFSGSTFHGVPNDKGQRWLCNSVMGPDLLDPGDYSDFVSHIRTIQERSPLKHNFLRVNLTVPGTLEKRDEPYTWDTRPRGSDRVAMWCDDDFDTVIENIIVAAKLVTEAGMEGLFLDMEQYGGDIWSFEKQKDAQALGMDWSDTRDRVRQRSEELFRALSEVNPEMTLVVIFYLYQEDERSLWNAFVDGMIAGCDSRMRIVNGNEPGYQLVSRAEFENLYRWHYDDALKYAEQPRRYLRQTEVGFGVWLDWMGWSEQPEIQSSSAVWQAKLENALFATDGYVWVYKGGSGAHTPNWWTGKNLPQSYIDATRRALKLAAARRED